MPYSSPNPPSRLPDAPYVPAAPPAAPTVPTTNAFGLGIPVNDWEAALLLYGIGLFVVDTSLGTIYLFGAWAVAMLMFVSQVGKSQPKPLAGLLPQFGQR